ncbi:hypothetical protein F4813DRAFT_223236 [Daldinia decipiens]|uniref:uncharacterized protein n=1 Tax=Daldinia decipiens TaxID=326647 RepID=UPI0020C48537|nr:uncharacterized protein F4813DRAFT_223236 [Daldinia decipiens]KAI1661282.1 hypothetical protein F4813DRAFT_223236 [Daldinia decipiens]
MSCQWRHNSHDNWEMTQSNPPSELPNDPIISTSSNPDERSSSPAMQDEHTQQSCGGSAQEIPDSLFSNAAQAETEPIPRDDYMPSPEDMLLPDSPSHPSLPSDFDDHIMSRRITETEAIQTPAMSSGHIAGRENGNISISDESASDFEMSESEGDGSDSTYIVGASTRRGKKKASDKKASSKASRSQTTAKSDGQNASVAKEAKQASAIKGRPRKVESTSKTASRRTKQVANTTSVQNPAANPKAKPIATQSRTSRHFQKGNKDDGLENLDKAVQKPQPPPGGQRAKLKSSTARLPKKSFYGGSNDGPSAQVAQDTNKGTKPQPMSDTGSGVKQSSNNRKQLYPASPIRIEDSDDGDDGDDYVWYPPESPAKEHKPPPKAPVSSKHSSKVPEVAVGPNSKKKRSPIQSEPKLRNSKNSPTRTYGQKPNKSINNNTQFHGTRHEEALHVEEPIPSESEKPQNQKPDISGSNPNPKPDKNIALTRVKKESNKTDKRKSVPERILEKPPTEATTAKRYSEPSEDTDMAPPRSHAPAEPQAASTQRALRKELATSASVASVTKDEVEQIAPRSLAIHQEPGYLDKLHDSQNHHLSIRSDSPKQELSDNYSANLKASTKQKIPDHNENSEEPKSKVNQELSPVQRVKSLLPAQSAGSGQGETYTRDVQEGLGGLNIHVEQARKTSVPANGQNSLHMEAEGYKKYSVNLAEATKRSDISKSDNSLKPSSIIVGNEVVFGRNPPQEPQQPAKYKEHFRFLDEHQAWFNHKTSWPQQTPLNFESQLHQASGLSSADRLQPLADSSMRLTTLKDMENHQHVSNPKSRIIFPSSPSERPLAKNTNDLMPQAPQLHPKSVDFASRIAQGYEQADFHQEANREVVNERTSYEPVKQQLSWFQPKVATKSRMDSKQLSPESAGFVGVHNGKGPRGYGKQQRNLTSKPRYEAKWQNAVEAASSGVVDTLHFISTSLLEHLRTREESVFAIVHEYKRNGTKISEKLVKRQTEEWRNASTAVEQKCLEVATLYEALSKETQGFRAKCLSKRRDQAYAEWQQQTARVKDAIRAAREETTLGREQ